MTINVLWMDGAEHYSTTANANISDIMTDGFWDTADGVRLTTDARTGDYAFKLLNGVSSFRRTVGGDRDRLGVVMSVNMEGLPVVLNTQFATVEFRNYLNYPILTVQVTPTGRVRVMTINGDADRVQSGISSREVAAGYHNHLEVKAIIGEGVKVRVNGKVAFTVEVTDALNSWLGTYDPDTGAPNMAGLGVASVHFGQISNSQTPMPNGATIFDDIAPYAFEEADDDTWLGLYGVYYLQPIADGTDTDFLKSSGSVGYSLVNTIAPDGDTSFIYSENPGDKSSFTVEPLPTNVVSVQAVAPVVYARKTDSGPGSIQLGVLSGATEQMNEDDIPVLTDYGFLQAPFDQDPDTSAPWSPTDLPQIIVERTV